MFSRTKYGMSLISRVFLVGITAFIVFSSIAVATVVAKPLTLTDALARARAAGFVAPAERARLQGAYAAVGQAGVIPNPSIGLDIENFAGSGPYRGVSGPETTLSYSQVIELGGKREARTTVALAELDATRSKGNVRILDLLREVELAWIEVAVASAQRRLAEDRLAISRSLREEIGRRAESGRDPAYAVPRAEAQVGLDEIALEQARSMERIAKASLAGFWRGGPDYTIDQTWLERPASPTERAYNAELALLESEAKVALARVRLELTRSIQDPTIKIGVRHFADTKDAALVAGFSIPLPLFDTNQGNIAKAQADQLAAENDIANSRLTLQREFARYRARLTG